MKSIVGFVASVLAVSAVSSVALAAPGKKPAPAKPAAADTLKCPSCGMPMPTKKTAAFPVPVKVKGKTYYCCPACPSGKAAAAAQAKPKAPKAPKAAKDPAAND